MADIFRKKNCRKAQTFVANYQNCSDNNSLILEPRGIVSRRELSKGNNHFVHFTPVSNLKKVTEIGTWINDLSISQALNYFKLMYESKILSTLTRFLLNKDMSFVFVTLIEIEIIKTMKQKQFLKTAYLFMFTFHIFPG